MRRRRAVELKQQGWTQRRIAEAFGVSEAAVSQWLSEYARRGEAAFERRQHRGPRKLTAEQLRKLPLLLAQGAEAYGFISPIWTNARVAELIKREFGVRYHKAHVSRILKQMGWTPQVPVERALQRDEAEIRQWREEKWPELKKKAPDALDDSFYR